MSGQVKEGSTPPLELKLIDGMLNGFALHEIICGPDGEPQDYRFLHVNPAFERMVGLSADQVIGRTVLEALPDTEKHWIETYGRVALSGEPAHIERFDAGLERHFEVLAFCPQPGQFAVVFTDITQRCQFEERLRLTQFSVDSARDAVYWMGPDAGFCYINDRACEALGYTRQELLELSVHDIDPEFPREVWPEHWAEVKRRRSFVLQSTHRRKDGSTFPVEVAINHVAFDGDEYNCAFARDISERQRVDQVMARAARLEATATLAGGIAHQFNNLLVAVLGNAELLKMQLREPSEAALIDEIMVSGGRAVELARQMLAFARGGKYVVETLCLNRVIDEARSLQERSLPPRVRVELDLEPELWPVQADRAQLGQVVINLCINAVEAIADQGRLVITTRNLELRADFTRDREPLVPGRYVYLSVEDSGSGLSEDARGRVFEPFFTTKEPGRGLGLAAVHGIINNHRGYVSTYSEPGLGATFKLYLPAVEATAARKRPASSDVPRREGVVLLVDDDDSVIKTTERMLQRLGYTVLVARDGQQAVDLAGDDGPIDVILLDMQMPVMGGSEAYPLLRELRPDARVLICSGYDLDASSQALIDRGADGFIQKPFRLRALDRALRPPEG